MTGDEIEKDVEQQNADMQEANAAEAVQRRLAESRAADRPDSGQADASQHFRRSAELIADWDKLDGNPVARRYLLERVGREMLAEFQVVPGELHDKQMPENLHGQYHPSDGWTDINEKLLKSNNPKEALLTYLHEYRHAYQDNELTTFRGAQWQTVDAARVRELSQPYEAPPPEGLPTEAAEKKFSMYEHQFVEADARDFAEHAVDKILKLRDELRAAEIDVTQSRSDADRIVEARLLGFKQSDN